MLPASAVRLRPATLEDCPALFTLINEAYHIECELRAEQSASLLVLAHRSR